MGAASAMNLPETIDEAGRRLRDGSLTVVELTQGFLECSRKLQPVLNAYITITEVQALEAAERLDAELAAGKDRGPLHGIPVVHKDNIATRGIRTTVGSGFLRDRVPDYDAAIVRRLEAKGMVMLGKANMSEFASGSSGLNMFFGTIHNPWNLERASGGSSNGTAAAVAAGMTLTGIGTDAGGSIRQPASRCGIFGLRPTFGRISLAGVWPRTRTLSAGGPMTRCVKDAALMMGALAGFDPEYAPSLHVPDEDFTRVLERGVRGLRLGMVENFTFSNIDPEIEAVIRDAVEVLARLGAEIVPVNVPALTDSMDYSKLFRNVLLYEFNQILGEQYRRAPKELFGPAIHSDLERGARVAAETYQQVLDERPARAAELKLVFKEVDALLTPVLPNVTPLQTAPAEVWARGRQFNLPFSFARLPSVSVPCGFALGMPVGLQVVANDLEEALLLRISAAFEGATNYHRRRPAVYCAGSV